MFHLTLYVENIISTSYQYEIIHETCFILSFLRVFEILFQRLEHIWFAGAITQVLHGAACGCGWSFGQPTPRRHGCGGIQDKLSGDIKLAFQCKSQVMNSNS